MAQLGTGFSPDGQYALGAHDQACLPDYREPYPDSTGQKLRRMYCLMIVWVRFDNRDDNLNCNLRNPDLHQLNNVRSFFAALVSSS